MASRRRSLTAAVAALGVMVLTIQQAGAAPTGSGPGSRSAASTATSGPHVVRAAYADPPTGSTAISNLGATTGWKVLTSATATQGGAAISTPGFSTSSWLSVANDGGGAPGTEIAALLQNGSCSNVFYSTNMKSCFGYMSKVGADTIAQFSVPWWYRTDFAAPPSGRSANLIINGVVGSADVWVNGTQVATAGTVTGAYARNSFNITPLLRSGTNSLAIEMHPNNPNAMLTLDNVDWTQIPPDNNTGIQFPVQLQAGGPLIIGNAHVNQNTASNLSSSALTVKADVTNSSGSAQTGTVSATITPPGGGSPVIVSQSVTVGAGATQTVTFSPSAYSALTINSPQIWWPYQLGAQPLYTLATSVAQGGGTLNSTSETFGIRTVDSYLTGASTAAPSGVRAFKVNNVPIVIRGGGWDPDLFLRYDPADTAKQIGLIKAMGVNSIRLEGHLMPADWYQQMDAAGILVNAGYQCCDFWENTSYTAAQQAEYQLTAQSLGQVLRNHPSVFSFQWSDNNPTDTQESLALGGFAAADYPGPFISSAEYNSSTKLGASGEKEGPYDWVPPNYWYDTSHYPTSDSTLTNAGGSWGYDSEQSAGNTVPTLDSINRFLSPADQAALWKTPGANQYHNNYEGTGHTGYSFGTLFNLDAAITNRYGAWSSLAQYVEEAQVQNYEDTRAQFEAFLDHSTNASQPSTGTIYWQMNKGWPTLLWSLYNNDGDQAGAYFGAQKANTSLHAIYTLDNGTVTLDNLTGSAKSAVTVEAKVYNTAGSVISDKTSASLTLASQQVANKVLTPTVPTAANTVYFVELLVRQNGNLVDRNVYWQSTTPDATNWSKTIGNPQATMTTYADLKALQNLPKSSISATAATSDQPGPNGADRLVTVKVTNTSTTPAVGFFLRADIRRGTASGSELPGDNELQSAIWSNNDVTLWPGESETLTATYKSAGLQGATPVVSVSGWNAAKIDVVAGSASTSNDFSLSVSPGSGSVKAGAAASATVSTAVTSGAAQSVALSASGLPSGASASFSPASVTAGGSASLSITTSASTPAGTYPVTITGTGPSATHSVTYALTVTATTGGCTAAQLLGNPGFENGSNPAPWTQSSTLGSNPVNNDTKDEPAHSGSWDAWLNGDGSADTDTIAQTVTIPTGCATASLSYWLHIDTTENTSTKADDTLTLQLLNSSGSVLATLAGYSNLNAATGYQQHSVNVSGYTGQTVTVKFTGTETDTNGGTTSFVIDDTALNVS